MIVRLLISFALLIDVQLFSSAAPRKPSDWDNWTFNQKIIWRGLNLDPRIPYGPLVDKLQAKKIVQNEMPTAKVFFATDDPSQIFIKKLPDSFVMKANNVSGRATLVKDGRIIATKKHNGNFVSKKSTNSFLRAYATKWLASLYGRNKETQYALIKPMILFEEYLEDITNEIGLFFFNGKVRVIVVYFTGGYTKKPMVSYYDENWNQFNITNHPTLVLKTEPIERPPYMDKLIAFGERFAEKIDHVRIDFFVSKNDVYFGEFTFTTAGGHNLKNLNVMVGRHWNFPDPNDPLVNTYLNDLLDGIGRNCE